MRKGLLRVCGWILVPVAAFVVFSGPGKIPNHAALAATGDAITGQGLIAFSSKIDQQRELLYLIDPVRQRICIYRVNYDGKKTTVSLGAVRHFSADLQLSEFNTIPSVAKIEGILGQTPRRK